MRALFDLLFPASCAGCARLGAVVCTDCADVLRRPARLRLPTPCPEGLPPPYAVADYAGSTRALVLAYKERDAVALTAALAIALGAAIDAATVAMQTPCPPLIVPVPSTRDALRRRGYDPVLRLVRATRRGSIVTALAHGRDVRDSAGLSAASRRRNMAGALTVSPTARLRLQGRDVLLVDDLVTTGATLAEAARALRSAGAGVTAAAVIAATARHGGSPDAGEPGAGPVLRGDLPNRSSQHYCS